MVKVALAGCASGFGRNILEAILATNKHSIVLLSRSPKPDLTARGVDVVAVGSYDDHAQLVSALRGVETVISTIVSFDEDYGEAQIRLLQAAKEARCRRFAPSEWAMKTNEGVDLYAPKIKVWKACEASGLEYTRFACGILTNTLVAGTPHNETEALSGLRPLNFIINIPSGTADIPGSRSNPARVTYISAQDCAKFVAAALDIKEKWWPEMGHMVGETTTYDAIVEAAERITGRTFLRKYVGRSELEESAKDPSKKFYYQVRIGIVDGWSDIEPNLNGLLPHVKPQTVEQYLRKYWEGVELPEPAWGEPLIPVA